MTPSEESWPDQHTYEACPHENRTPEEHTYEGLHSGVSAEQSAYVVIDNKENRQDTSAASTEGKHTSEKCFLRKRIELVIGIIIGFAVVLIITVTCSIIFSCKY